LDFLKDCASFQRRLMKEATNLLKKNGVLVYSVCTINPMEGEENVLYAIKDLGLELVAPPKKFQNFKYASKGLTKEIQITLFRTFHSFKRAV
jgi:16S rRNA C967 or C1407 C5-methylase (RsmB/RsmF family)